MLEQVVPEAGLVPSSDFGVLHFLQVVETLAVHAHQIQEHVREGEVGVWGLNDCLNILSPHLDENVLVHLTQLEVRKVTPLHRLLHESGHAADLVQHEVSQRFVLGALLGHFY